MIEWIYFWNNLAFVYAYAPSSDEYLIFTGKEGRWLVPVDATSFAPKFEVQDYFTKGRFVLIVPGRDRPMINIDMDDADSAPYEISDITVAMYDDTLDEMLAPTKLVIRFSSSWDETVTNYPHFIFEAPSTDLIEISNLPKHVRLEKKRTGDDAVVGASLSGGEEPDGGLGAAAIAGIIIGVIAVVGIAGFCVWFFVLRDKGMDDPDA
jgi:hypothetical protein